MRIRTKLTLSFFTIVIIILGTASLSIYFFFEGYRENDFYRRLKNRAVNTAKLLVEVEGVDAELLKRIEKDDPSNLPDQYIIIHNYKNERLYASRNNPVISVTPSLLDRIHHKGELQFKYGDYEVLGFLYNDKNESIAVVAAAMDVYGRQALQNLKNILLSVFATSLVIISISGWFYAGKVLSPISEIVNKVDNISEVSLHSRLDEGNNSDELDKLSQTFNRMLSRLEEAFMAQKNFIANASHELRTPIAIISAEIEATLLQSRTSGQYEDVLRSILESTKGLNTLSNQLLLLAQTSARLNEKGFTQLRIDETLWEVKQAVEKVRPEYKINIDFDITLNDEAMKIQGDEPLMRIVFSNLIDNGCKYSDDNTVKIMLKGSEKFLIIQFQNNGQGIAPHDLNNIFAPFYRGKNASNIKGYGIGLPLASRIVILHKGKLSVDSTAGGVTRFTVTLPYC